MSTDRLPTILIADQTELLRRNLSSYLEAEGYQVLQANSGAEALTVLTRERPDAVIVEIDLPGVSAIELMNIARTRLNLTSTRFILLNNSEQIPLPEAVLGAEAFLVVHKPVVMDAVVKRLNVELAPWPELGDTLAVTSVKNGHVCHLSTWSRNGDRGLKFELGPELDWLGGDFHGGFKVTIGYSGPHDSQLKHPATMRMVSRRGGAQEVVVTFDGKLPFWASLADEAVPRLQFRYASRDGDYHVTQLINVSPTALRLGGIPEEFALGQRVPLFIFSNDVLQFATRGIVYQVSPQGPGRYTTLLGYEELNNYALKHLIALLKPGCFAPGSRPDRFFAV